MQTLLYSAFIVIFSGNNQPLQLGEQVFCPTDVNLFAF